MNEMITPKIQKDKNIYIYIFRSDFDIDNLHKTYNKR